MLSCDSRMFSDVTKRVGLGELEEAQSVCAAVLEQGSTTVLGSAFEQPNLAAQGNHCW